MCFNVLETIVGFSFVEYISSETKENVLVCVDVLSSEGALRPFTVVILPEEGIVTCS